MSPISATSPTAVSVSIPRRQRNRATAGAHGPWTGLLGDQRVEPVAAREQHLVVAEVLAEDRVDAAAASKRTLPQPRQMALDHVSPGPVEDMPAAQQQLADPVARAPSDRRADPRARGPGRAAPRSSIAGTTTGRNCPAACNRASLSASRVSVLTRSPGWRGIAPGEQTITSIPAARPARASPNPVGPAS